MAMPATASRFQTTSWTLIVRARQGGDDLAALLKNYRDPVYAYLRRDGRSTHDADDHTQAFLCDVLLDGNLLQRADQSRGRFRSFLLKALRNYLIDIHRESAGRPDSGRPTTFSVDDPALLAAAEPWEEDDPAAAYDRQWATTVFNMALERVEEACRQNGMTRQWTAFEERVLRPAQQGCQPTPVEELMQRFGVARRSEIDSMLQTIKRKVEHAMLDVLAETVNDPKDVDAEMAELRRYLAM